MKKKIVIFLDIDGVIATHKQWDLSLKSPLRFKEYHNAYPFDQKCVKILNEILQEFNIKIILHSDWIYKFNINELQELFQLNGVIQVPEDVAHGYYSMDHFRNRMLRLEHYIKEKGLKDYIILDDMPITSLLWGDRFIHVERDTEGIKQSGFKEKIRKKLKNFS